MAMWDQGHWGIGSGCSRPAGSWCDVLVMLQTEKFLTKVVMSADMEGNQNLFWVMLMVPVIPGWPELGNAWMCLSRAGRNSSGIKGFDWGQPSGGESALTCSISVIISHWTGARINVSGRMVSLDGCIGIIVETREGVCFHVLWTWLVCYSEMKSCEEHGPSCLSVIHSLSWV